MPANTFTTNSDAISCIVQFDCCGARNFTDFERYAKDWTRKVTCYNATFHLKVNAHILGHTSAMGAATIQESTAELAYSLVQILEVSGSLPWFHHDRINL